MNPIIKNILAVILGWLVGSAVNMGLVNLGYTVFPFEGLDPSDMESIIKAMPNFKPQQFLFPFLAHALGTLVGAVVAYKLAVSHKMKFSLGIGSLFLLGGIMMVFMVPSPTWFNALDILVSYIPMAWVGGKLAEKFSNK